MMELHFLPVRVVESPESTEFFLQIAKLDREVWGEGPGARAVPDGEHAWRLWTEHAYVAAAIDSTGDLAGSLVAFPTVDPRSYFVHKLFVAPRSRRSGMGRLLLAHFCTYADQQAVSSAFSTDPGNNAMIELSDSFGFRTTDLVQGYYGPGKDRLIRVRDSQQITPVKD
jgi:GNAT superfamily N-acetyltransferase